MAPSPEEETQDLIDHLSAKHRRRRWTRALLIGTGALALLAALATGVVLGTAPGDEAAGADATTVPGATTDTAAAMSTIASEPPATAGGATTTASPPSQSPVTTQPVMTTAPNTSTTSWLAGKVVVVDPGHQGKADSALEPIGPGSRTRKARVSAGTSSTRTGVPESEVALAVGLKLRDALEGRGLTVIMTRVTENADISNLERAQVWNGAHADLAVRLHANGSGDSSVHGLFTLYPASIEGWTDDIATASKEAATIAQQSLILATGAQDRGLQERSDLTGFNWSDVPVILVEMGFMSNPTEDEQLRTPAYQDKIVQGLVEAITTYLGAER